MSSDEIKKSIRRSQARPVERSSRMMREAAPKLPRWHVRLRGPMIGLTRPGGRSRLELGPATDPKHK